MYKGVVLAGPSTGVPLYSPPRAPHSTRWPTAPSSLRRTGSAIYSRRLCTHCRRAQCRDVQVNGFGAAFGIRFGDDKNGFARYVRAMLDQGIYLLPDGRAFLCPVRSRSGKSGKPSPPSTVCYRNSVMNGKRLVTSAIFGGLLAAHSSAPRRLTRSRKCRKVSGSAKAISRVTATVTTS
jgi:hypothetical protein